MQNKIVAMKRLSILSVFVVLALIGFAHEYVLLASKYRLKRGDELEMRLFVADGFNIQIERPFQKAPTRSFELITPAGRIDLSTTKEGSLPMLQRAVDFDGGGLVNLERDYSRISLSTPDFLHYLEEDHIDGISAKVNKTLPNQTERYSRYIKALVQSGSEYNDTLYKKVIGQNLEIVLLQNPYQLKVNDEMQAMILFMGKPMVNKTVSARNRTGSEPATVQLATTNRQGICSFHLTRGGEWFIHLTHMIECPDKSDSEWESFWASYSFAIDAA